jgi:hypothetical protein
MTRTTGDHMANIKKSARKTVRTAAVAAVTAVQAVKTARLAVRTAKAAGAQAGIVAKQVAVTGKEVRARRSRSGWRWLSRRRPWLVVARARRKK